MLARFHKIHKIFLILILFVINSKSQGQDLSDLDGFIQARIEEWKVPGLAIAVIKGDSVIHMKGYGVRDLEKKQPVTSRTLFSIASATKSFTATTAGMLVDDKKIDLDIPLQTYFPDFKLFDPYASDKVTLRDLLCHRSGLVRQEFFRINEPETREGVMYRMRYFEPGRDFRSVWQYSNMGYTVAGTMLAQRAGTTWENLVQTRILDPLGMKSTVFSVNDMQESDDFAYPYIDWEEEPECMDFYNADLLGPAGCIVTNVEDLSKWALFQLNKGMVDEKQLISPRTLATIQMPHMTIPRPIQSPEKFYQFYGLGWFIEAYRGHLHVHHGGVLYGFTSLVSFLPQDDVGVVLLANLNGTPVTTIIESYVYDLLLGLDPLDWNQQYLERAEQIRAYYKRMEAQEDPHQKTKTKPSKALINYTGIYRSDGYGDISIVQEKDGLKAKLTTIDCPLTHYHDDVFDMYHAVKHKSWKVQFEIGPSGTVDEFSVPLPFGASDVVFKRVSAD